MNRITATLLLIFSASISLLSQISDQQHYQILLSEASILKNYKTFTDTSLIDSAKTYAARDDFLLASAFLEMYLNDAHSDQLPKSTFTDEKQARPFNLELSSGVDFNRQEFEVGYIQTDSIIAEEVSKPFVDLRLHQNLRLHWQWETAFRYDKENLLASAYASYNNRLPGNTLDARIGVRYNKNSLYPDYGYLEWNNELRYQKDISADWQLRVENEIRLKQYRSPSRTIPDFFKDMLYFDIIRYRKDLSDTRISYRLDYNESLNFDNNDYTEQTITLRSNNDRWAAFISDAEIAYRHNRFSYFLGDSVFNNASSAFLASADLQWYLLRTTVLKMKYMGKYKIFKTKTEQDPDYHEHDTQLTFRYHFSDYFSMECGYTFELRRHIVHSGGIADYITEQNYYGHGVVGGADLTGWRDVLFSAGAVYTWRRYPDHTTEDIIGFYTDRNVLSLFTIAQIPVNRKLYFNLFAAYDNDTDLDRDESNTRNTLFSAELKYTF